MSGITYRCSRHGETDYSTYQYPTRVQRRCRACERERSRTRARDRKVLVLRGYGNKCQCCGEAQPEFLSIDHMAGNGHVLRKTIDKGALFYTRLIKEEFPAGYQILCMNCNFAKGRFGQCPHGGC